MKKFLSRLITSIALLVFLYAGYQLIHFGYDYYTNRQVMDELQAIYYDAPMEVEEQTSNKTAEKQIRPGFEELLAENNDVVGWITIDDTKIDYPIVQGKDNETYLNRNFFHEETRAGSIFMDYRNDVKSDENKNMIIYGHRMKDGTMFQQLTKYLDQTFVEEHPTFTIDTLYGQYEATVFAAYQTMTDFDYIRTDFSAGDDFSHFLDEVDSTSEISPDVAVNESDQIVTLSTCDYALDPDKGRLVVQAKLTEMN